MSSASSSQDFLDFLDDIGCPKKALDKVDDTQSSTLSLQSFASCPVCFDILEIENYDKHVLNHSGYKVDDNIDSGPKAPLDHLYKTATSTPSPETF